jgi:ABC-type transport system involved in multi-copper enzyme maturation permease subunit
MNLVNAFRAEWMKLRKRPAVWILLIALPAIVLLFGYVALWAFARQAPPEAAQSGLDTGRILQVLSPARIPGQVLNMVSGFGGAFGLILGGLAVGSEYGWGTLKTVTTQRPARSALMGGRVLALLTVCVLLALMAFLGGAAGAGLVSLLEPAADTTPPEVVDAATAFGVSVLIIALWCGLGVCFATLFRGTGWAIGFGLLYAFALEFLLGQVPLRGRAGELLSDALINNNTAALVSWLSPGAPEAFGAPAVDIEPLQAIVVLLGYLAVALLVAMIVYGRRDIA